MSILRRYVKKKILINFQFPHHFDVLLLCNFGERKIDVVSTYFFRRNFAEQNIDVISMYFFRTDFAGQKINVVLVYFWRNLGGKLM